MNLPICVRIDADDFCSRESLLKDGWVEVEILETWQRVIGNEDYECGGVQAIDHLKADAPGMGKAAFLGGGLNRMRTTGDPEAVEEYFQNWVNDAIKQQKPMFRFADSILDFATRGFIILEDDGAIDLLRVNNSDQFRGIGTALVNRAMIYFRDRGIKTIRAGTQQSNESAQRFYSKLGFTVVKRERTFHKTYK